MPKPHKYHVVILLVVAVICFGAGGQYGRYQQRSEEAALALLAPVIQEEEAPAVVSPEPVAEPAPLMMLVHVKGAVERPGVYELEEGSRVIDAIDEAGLLTEANTDIVNLAAVLRDGMEVVIPYRVEGEETDWQELAASSALAKADVDTGSGGGAVTRGSVNINTAGSAELQTLTGIGPAKAEDIIAYRQEHGGFGRIEDIKKVKGIGDATFEKIKDSIVAE